MSNQSRSKTRLSRALGVALTPKAAKYMEKARTLPVSTVAPSASRTRTTPCACARSSAPRPVRHPREAARIAFNEARRTDGLTGENLVELLEMRLDALVLRAGFARTISQARQFVVHRHILVDGKIVDRPSFRVKPGQVIGVKQRSEGTEPFQVAAAGGHVDVLPKVPATSRSSSTSCRPSSCVARSAPRCPSPVTSSSSSSTTPPAESDGRLQRGRGSPRPRSVPAACSTP